MSTVFEELAGSPSGSFSDGKFTGKRTFLVAWSDWLPFMGELYGAYTLTGGTVTFNSPAFFPGFPQAICTDISFAPLAGDDPVKNGTITLHNNNAVTYEKAKITATYKIPFSNSKNKGRDDLPGIPKGTFLDFSSDHGAEYVTTASSGWKWTDDGEEVSPDVPTGLLMPTEDVSLTWSRVTSPPWSAIRGGIGKINSSPFLNYDVGKVLFTGVRSSKSFQLTEQTFWKLDYAFRVRTQEWNKFYKPKDKKWQEVDDGSGTKPYSSTSFSDLFQFE